MQRNLGFAVCFGIVVSCGWLSSLAWEVVPVAQRGSHADRLFSQGNVKEALDAYRSLLIDATYDGANVADYLSKSVNALQRLDRLVEADALLEATVAAHAQNWRIVAAVADAYRTLPHHGFIVAGKFERGNHRGGGEYAMVDARDRVRALQLYVAAMPAAAADPSADERCNFYHRLADALITHQFRQAWRLQALSDLSKLPDPEEGYRYRGGEQPGTPVDEAGEPIYYAVPESFDKATSDGERWRWALQAAADAVPARAAQSATAYADFLNEQFGVQTMAQFGDWFGAYRDDDAGKNRPQTFALHTLADDETIARLATGIRRFKLPREHDPIRIYREVAAGNTGYASQALDALAAIYENRRQYDRAAETWAEGIRRFGDQNHRTERRRQIVDAWGTFEPGTVQPAGRGAEL